MALIRRGHIGGAVAVVLLVGSIASAQDTRGELFGKVTDRAGAALAGVKVTIAGPALPQEKTVATDASGIYHVVDLPAGTYNVGFVIAGFFPFRQESVVVRGGAHVALDASLAATGEPRQTAATPSSPALAAGEVAVRLQTALGVIDIAVDTAHAPVTSANFLKYIDGGFYAGGRFYRITRPGNYTPAPPNRPMMEIIQGGINPARAGEQFAPIPLERTSVTGLKHVVGTVSMARGAADTARSDFFILLDDQPSLDFGGKRFDDAQGAAAFGRVIAGMDVVRKIQQQPATGDRLDTPVPIVSAARMK